MERQMKSDALNALADLERSEFYLREGERAAQMGSWSLKSDGTFDYCRRKRSCFLVLILRKEFQSLRRP